MFSSNCKSKKVLNLAQKKVTLVCLLFFVNLTSAITVFDEGKRVSKELNKNTQIRI